MTCANSDPELILWQTLCGLSEHFSILQKRNKSRSQRQKTGVIHTGVDNDATEGKTRIKPLAKVLQVKKNQIGPIQLCVISSLTKPAMCNKEWKEEHKSYMNVALN